ncbi:LysM peptidoglycan-binding domain-containing protein [Thiomicrorhabdus sediminis]|uniref:LysM peptidoglycan-binding domain-containing protein n=1 Tax=Thiomicrorhabdus sediminis TaxID=2580412 RepID=A0A4P9K7D1_9GAMM|nr:LysM peptidoglycan-binding domain-containing protein [Thiomicrorhabdus sediminis]QCU90370.1 LysM peptidoglycan-binding domain-containing protein [Thiomicrorhabdus sediminis]
MTAPTNSLIPVNSIVKPHLLSLGLISILTLNGCVSNQSLQSSSQSQTSPLPPQTQVPANQSNGYAHNERVDITPDHPVADIEQAVEKQRFEPIIWNAMRGNFELSRHYLGQYNDYIKFFEQRKKHLERVSERAEPYMYYIYNQVQSRQLPYELALLPIIESGFRPHARSHQRAVGLWQFIPSTAELYDLDRNWWYDARKDVVSSTEAALSYLQKLYKLNNNDWLLALASYNGGIGNVYKAQRKYRKKHNLSNDSNPDFWQIRPYLPRETQSYVPKLLAVAHLIEKAEDYQLALAPVANRPFFTVIELEKQVALNQVASLSNTPLSLLESLNPGYHQMATPPKGPFNVILPIDNAQQLQQKLPSNPQIYAVQWQKYKIRSGDSLSVIAHKFKTSTGAIKALNGMKNSRIRAGKTLLIPIPAALVDTVNKQLAGKPSQGSVKSASKPKQPTHWHTVKAGDSIWELARYYNVSNSTLCQWNNIDMKTPLRIGQKLAIYKEHYRKKLSHTVKNGENLWVIGNRYGVSSKDIAGWNGISRKKPLQPGQVLTIWSKGAPSEHIVKSGDNLWLIAKANQLSAKKLAEFNQLSLNKPLQPGQVILIPINDKQS